MNVIYPRDWYLKHMKNLVWALSTVKFEKRLFPFFSEYKNNQRKGQIKTFMSVPIGPLLIDLVLCFIHLVNSTSVVHLSNVIMNI